MTFRFFAPVLLAMLVLILPPSAHADGFAALVSPPRVETSVKPGATERQIVSITNADNRLAHYTLHTADWTLSSAGSPDFSDALAADSCRPWVAIEQNSLDLAPGATARFRFEVTPPPNTSPRECRFALMVESAPEVVKSGNVPVPVSGRLGIIVYVAVGDVAPSVRVEGLTWVKQGSLVMPALRVTNTGTAHGRLEGFVDATDADGTRWSLTSSTLPVLPGETRVLAFAFDSDKTQAPVTWRLPLHIKGRLDVGSDHVDLDQSLTAAP